MGGNETLLEFTLTLSPHEEARHRVLGVNHKAIYLKGLDAYEQERQPR